MDTKIRRNSMDRMRNQNILSIISLAMVPPLCKAFITVTWTLTSPMLSYLGNEQIESMEECVNTITTVMNFIKIQNVCQKLEPDFRSILL